MAARVSRVADLPENDLQDVPKNRIGTGPLFCRLKNGKIPSFQQNLLEKRISPSAWT
jgi:hypothetical protein